MVLCKYLSNKMTFELKNKSVNKLSSEPRKTMIKFQKGKKLGFLIIFSIA